jgi:hypothetical protein
VRGLQLAEKVNHLEIGLGRVEQRVENLEGWQKTQNGAIHDVNKKVDRLQYWIMGLLASSLVSLALLVLK